MISDYLMLRVAEEALRAVTFPHAKKRIKFICASYIEHNGRHYYTYFDRMPLRDMGGVYYFRSVNTFVEITHGDETTYIQSYSDEIWVGGEFFDLRETA